MQSVSFKVPDRCLEFVDNCENQTGKKKKNYHNWLSRVYPVNFPWKRKKNKKKKQLFLFFKGFFLTGEFPFKDKCQFNWHFIFLHIVRPLWFYFIKLLLIKKTISHDNLNTECLLPKSMLMIMNWLMLH